jgi:hypothetical protein
MIMNMTGVAESITVASAIVPKGANPKPASPFVVPASRITSVNNTTAGPRMAAIIGQPS